MLKLSRVSMLMVLVVMLSVVPTPFNMRNLTVLLCSFHFLVIRAAALRMLTFTHLGFVQLVDGSFDIFAALRSTDLDRERLAGIPRS